MLGKVTCVTDEKTGQRVCYVTRLTESGQMVRIPYTIGIPIAAPEKIIAPAKQEIKEEVTEHAINLLQVNPKLPLREAAKQAVDEKLRPKTLAEKAGSLLPLAAVAGTIWLAWKGGGA